MASLATLTVASVLALLGLTGGAAATDTAGAPPASGAMICDGSTGCYIIPEGLGAWLADCTTPDYSSGPFRCLATVTAASPATETTVNTHVHCQVYVGFPAALVYESTNGTIVVRQIGTTVTLRAICPHEIPG